MFCKICNEPCAPQFEKCHKHRHNENLNERELENDYPVYFGYLYIVDKRVIRSNIQGTISDLKKDLRAKVIKNCDMIGRDLK